MRLIIIGSEYTGKTTLAKNIVGWLAGSLGEPAAMLHDHFLPSIAEPRLEISAEELEDEFLSLKPWALEMYMRYMGHYHLGHHFYIDNDHLVVNWYYGEAVYAPLYFGYGGVGEYADRRSQARHHDSEVMHIALDTVLVYLTATPEVIRARAKAEPRPRSRVKDEDIELINERFAEEFSLSLLRRRIAIDTSESTPEETMKTFLKKVEPHLTQSDRLRLLAHAALVQ
jgi:hypothetical protein